MALTVELLREHLGQDPASITDAAALEQAVKAANASARAHRPDVTETEPWPDDIIEGTVLLAARTYGRRGSVPGIAAYAEAGAIPLGRLDPDVRLYWRLGEFQPSVVA